MTDDSSGTINNTCHTSVSTRSALILSIKRYASSSAGTFQGLLRDFQSPDCKKLTEYSIKEINWRFLVGRPLLYWDSIESGLETGPVHSWSQIHPWMPKCISSLLLPGITSCCYLKRFPRHQLQHHSKTTWELGLSIDWSSTLPKNSAGYEGTHEPMISHMGRLSRNNSVLLTSLKNQIIFFTVLVAGRLKTIQRSCKEINWTCREENEKPCLVNIIFNMVSSWSLRNALNLSVC